MTSIAEHYCGKIPTGCVGGPPKCPTPGMDVEFSNVCHRHVRIPQWTIITCSAASIFIGFVMSVLLFWVTYAEQQNIDKKWVFFSQRFEAFLSDTGNFPILLLVVFVVIWHLATVVACHRKYTSISDYIVVTFAVPMTGMTVFATVVRSIIE